MSHDFVQLHDTDADSVFVRAARITAVMPGDPDGSDVWIEHDNDMVHVIEPPAVVIALVEDLDLELPDGAVL